MTRVHSASMYVLLIAPPLHVPLHHSRRNMTVGPTVLAPPRAPQLLKVGDSGGVSAQRAQCAHDMTGEIEVLLQLVIFLPIQMILHPHNVGQPHNAIRILFILTVPRYGEKAIAEIRGRQRGRPNPQPERGQSKSKTTHTNTLEMRAKHASNS